MVDAPSGAHNLHRRLCISEALCGIWSMDCNRSCLQSNDFCVKFFQLCVIHKGFMCYIISTTVGLHVHAIDGDSYEIEIYEKH